MNRKPGCQCLTYPDSLDKKALDWSRSGFQNRLNSRLGGINQADRFPGLQQLLVSFFGCWFFVRLNKFLQVSLIMFSLTKSIHCHRLFSWNTNKRFAMQQHFWPFCNCYKVLNIQEFLWTLWKFRRTLAPSPVLREGFFERLSVLIVKNERASRCFCGSCCRLLVRPLSVGRTVFPRLRPSEPSASTSSSSSSGALVDPL